MFRLVRPRRGLPFEPMALSTFDVFERAAAAASPSGSSPQGPPYFVSPKHDGVRIVSYVPPQAESTKSTCFSRFGRPIYGVTWIEEELRLLRWLSGDPRLVLDGELYIHRSHNPRTASSGATQTGFLAVSALVHRLRSAKSACSSEDEVLRYVASLPIMCVFDIVSFQPNERVKLGGDKSGRGIPRIEKERLAILRGVMEANHISDLEMVRVIPNHSVFSQRLKALHFLASLLERARASSTFFPERMSSAVEECSGVEPVREPVPAYQGIGGKYVKLVPYTLITSLEEVRTVYLDKYLSTGYEGAVVRSASNVYEIREKEKKVLQGLLDPLITSLKPSLFALHSRNESRRNGVRVTGGTRLLRVHSEGGCVVTCDAPGATETDTSGGNKNGAGSDEAADHREIVEKVLRRAKTNGRRSPTAAKLLPFADKEYAILRPLLKPPTADARSRSFLRIPVSSLHESLGVSAPRTPQGRAAMKGNNSDTVIFYGVQCLSDTGRVFNVSLPKMNAENQQALLRHLLDVTGGRKGGGTPASGRTNKRSLTGLYATVKYQSLTEYGVPRFGQVKGIRGGKGWFV
ncbi:DNA ligase [Trypanosoma brucei equiperdum]|uniref:DNA ligase n=1 Tax=Trypanosoma brucei equiperdum TaxID=630700 RepID=A0A3L6KTQ0_9TRYP|nr:DNA ligase [Trypanosoma brucei equiperdum]